MTLKHITYVTFLKKYLSSTIHESEKIIQNTMKFLFALTEMKTVTQIFLIILLLSCSYIKMIEFF